MRVNISIPDQDHSLAKEYCEKHGLTFSRLLREAIREKAGQVMADEPTTMDDQTFNETMPKTAKVLVELDSFVSKLNHQVSPHKTIQSNWQFKEEIKNELSKDYTRKTNELLRELSERHTNLMKQYSLMLAEMQKYETQSTERIQEYFDSSEYMEKLKKQVLRFVKQEVITQLAEQGINDVIYSKIESNLSGGLKPFVADIVEKTLSGMQKRFSRDIRITKELCYSVESEITHLTQRTGISYSMEEQIRKRIDKCFAEMSPEKMRLLEDNAAET